jgi:putative transposase
VPVCRLARHHAPPSPVLPYRPRRYPSDTTDAEWALLEPLLPPPASGHGRGGRPEAHHRRDIVDAIRYVAHNGCVWRALPCDFPPWRTVYGFYWRWNASGATTVLHDQLRTQVRLAAGRNPQPSAAIIDSQSVRAADTVPRSSRGFDAAKKINGRKRHLAVDTLGLLLAIVVTAASVQDRDGARPLLWRLRVAQRHIRLVWADAAYAGRLVAWAMATLRLRVQLVRRRLAHAFEVLPRRWVIERTFAWLSRYRRTVRDYERLPEHHQAMVQWAMITIMTRRLARRHRPAHTPTPTLATAA